MLILSRKIGESFFLNDEIEIVVTEISGDKVRIGISAPKEVKVLRNELRQTMESNRQAAGSVLSRQLFAQLDKLGKA